MKNPAPAILGFVILGVVGVFLISAIREGHKAPDAPESPTFAGRGALSIESLRQELGRRIELYRRGETKALPFLSAGATNLELASLRESQNTNLRSAEVVFLGNGHRHYLEVPLAVFPLTFIPTLPGPPSAAELRRHVEQEIQHFLRGETSKLKLPNYQWTNIFITSFSVASNYTASWPYGAQVVLLAQGFAGSTGNPVEHRCAFLLNYQDEGEWDLWYQGAP